MSRVICTAATLSPGAVSSAASLEKEAPGVEAGKTGEASVGGRRSTKHVLEVKQSDAWLSACGACLLYTSDAADDRYKV